MSRPLLLGRRGFFGFIAGAVLAAPSLPGLLAEAPRLARMTMGRIEGVRWMTSNLPFNSALAHSLESAARARSWFDEGVLVGPRGDRVVVTRVRPLTVEPDPAWREPA